MGFGTDQGKLGNINGMAILAQALGKSIPETGTTTYRPNYTPVSFGAFAGRELGEFLDRCARPACMSGTPGARAVRGRGQLEAALVLPAAGRGPARRRAPECLAVRNGVGILDASTLGKIDIQGPTRWPC